ncbi:hypothetical protein Cni_G24352 [Canna indica]|uniref:Uncharacterized protein n=1 Tax=Canna indica TaxID=4628 RepID=A0AAQ3QND1_9LILI|nr:hypothetical protein Cni_G24352 [Canna indica]
MRGWHPFLLSFFFLACVCAAGSGDGGSAYEVLRSHGLPIGLLPKGVSEFRLDQEGRFEARLDAAPCTARFESDVRYNATITGTISPGQIAGLSGVSALDLFLWFLVRAIRVDDQTSGIIHFDVGVVVKRLPLTLFETPPDCVPVSSLSPDDHFLLEASRIAALVSKSQSGAPRYQLETQESSI